MMYSKRSEVILLVSYAGRKIVSAVVESPFFLNSLGLTESVVTTSGSFIETGKLVKQWNSHCYG
jgi:hypothetical protein